jgi:hypothetical protein
VADGEKGSSEMKETTNKRTATKGSEVEEHGLRKYLGRYLRIFLVPLIALAIFGAASMAAPKDAQAAGTGYYWTNHGGLDYQCWWVQYQGGSWYEDGCIVYYGTTQYYYQWATGKHFFWYNAWIDVSNYWYNYSDFGSFTIPGYTQTLDDYNRSSVDFFMANSNNAIDSIWTSSDGASTRMASELSGPGPEAPASSGVPEAGSEATEDSAVLRTSEVSTTADYPWKVCQDDNSKCMRYSGKAWKQVNTTKAKGGTYHVSSSEIKGAFFSAAGATDAGGRTMTLTTKTGPKMGKARVLVVNLANARVVEQETFDLRTAKNHYKVAKSITGLTRHKPYGLVVLSANGKPVAVDSVGYEAHGSMCHNVV